MLLSTGEQVSVALMAMAIESLGVPAISFTGAQIGLVTDSFHTKARIRNISTERMAQALDEGKIVIVAGFQGVDENYNITTLGRGGSDTTAVALAAVLGAAACEIYTDVDGVYTTDPRIVPEAGKIDRISYDEMLELASLGAGVMHSRSIEFAKKYGVPIHVRSSFSDADRHLDRRRGGRPPAGRRRHRRGPGARTRRGSRSSACPTGPGVVHPLFQHDRQGEHRGRHDRPERRRPTGRPRSASPSPRGTWPRPSAPPRPRPGRSAPAGVTHDAEVAKVSVVGLGMRTHTGVATAMFEALAEAGVNIQMITTSEIKISVLVDRASAVAALRAVHKAFLLDEDPRPAPAGVRPATSDHPGDEARPAGRPRRRRAAGAGMEDLVIAGVELDETQAADHPLRRPRPARLRGQGLPRDRRGGGLRRHDRPERQPRRRAPILSFTVPRDAADRAAARRRGRSRPGQVAVEPTLAKLSVIGRGHAHPHRRRHPHVRRPGRAVDQHQPDQHQRGPHQRRHRRRQGARGARMPQEGLRAEWRG